MNPLVDVWLQKFSGEFPWTELVRLEIDTRRAHLSDILIYDILLSSGGIQDTHTLYPPADEQSLTALLSAIADSRYDSLKKDCLVFFLLKWYQDDREVLFADAKCIPHQFTKLSNAYWSLDTGINIAQAVSTLADARLNRDYASKIIQAIALGPHSSQEMHSLVLKYVRTAKPLLTEPDDLDVYIVSLVESGSIYEAWQFQRTFDLGQPVSGSMQERLIHRILEWTLYPAPKPLPLKCLMLLPLTARESEIVREYATNPPPITTGNALRVDTGNVRVLSDVALSIIRDLVCLREIQMGRWAEGIRAQREFIAATTVKKDPGDSQRAKMMTEILSALPAVEKSILEAELASGPLPTLNSANSAQSIRDTDTNMEMSWESVRPSSSRVEVSKPVNGFSLTGPDSINKQVKFTPLVPWAPLVQPHTHFIPNTFNSVNSVPSPTAFTAPVSSLNVASTSASVHGPPLALNKNRNAFYDPLSSSGFPNKLSLPAVTQSPIADDQSGRTSPEHPVQLEEEDAPMDTDDEVIFTSRASRRRAREGNTGTAAAEGLNYSVFSGSKRDVKQPRIVSNSRRNAAKTPPRESSKMPPGGFFEDVEDEPAKKEPATREKETRSNHQTRQQEPDAGLGRSLPGSLMDDDNEHYGIFEEQEEEQDDLAPLPAPTRKAKPKAAPKKAVDTAPRRRSSRLSVASSQGEDEASPPTTRKTTRAGGTRKTRR